MKFCVYSKYYYGSKDYREDENTTIETALQKTIIYIHKKIDMLKNERLEVERKIKIAKYKEEQQEKYDNYINEKNQQINDFINFEKFKRNKLFKDSKFWYELKQVKEFIDYIKSQNDPANEDWLNWAYSFLDDINPAKNNTFSNYDN